MPRNVKLAAYMLPAVLLWGVGCKSKSSNPEKASQPPAQTSPAPSNPASPPATSAGNPAATQPAPATPSGVQASGNPESTTATNTAAAPAAPVRIVVPAGTVLHVRLVQPVGSRISQEGQRFDATLSSPITVKGQRVIPRGTRAVGTVTEAHPAGRFKGGATLGLDLNALVIDGRTYPIRTSMVTSESKGKGKRSAAMIGGGTGAGALIGGLAGGGKGALIGGLIGGGAGTAGAATGNRDITLRSETPLSFRLRSSVSLPRLSAPANPRPQP